MNMKEQIIQLALMAGVAFAIAILVTLSWYWLDKKDRPRIAVVDIASIVKIKQTQFTEMLSKPGITDDDRKRAYDQIQHFGADLGSAVKELPGQCGCIVINKAAIVAGKMDDVTPTLKSALGMK